MGSKKVDKTSNVVSNIVPRLASRLVKGKTRYLFLIFVIFVVLGILGKDFAINLFIRMQMDELLLPSGETRLLVIAPHCDDETLGCGGLISKTLDKGGEVRVVLLTNGDGHTSAVALNTLSIKPNAKKYLNSAYLRQNETEKAMVKAGVDKSNIIYLGYPDGGLYPMWSTNWDMDSLYISKFTKCSYSPYYNSYKKNAPYCGASVAEDLESIVNDFHPDIIAFPHPNDRHPDHFAAYCFVKYIITRNNIQPDQYLYLVHRGKWPSPFGHFNRLFLVPPKRLINIGTEWVSLPMSETEQKLKADMLSEYKSQLSVNSPFLRAFLRKNELFGVYADLEYDFLSKGKPKILLLEDPVNDKIKQSAGKSADIKHVYLSADSSNMHLFLNTAKNTSKNIYYHIDMYFFAGDQKTFRVNMTIKNLSAISLKNDTTESITEIKGLKLIPEGDMLHISLPYGSIPDFNYVLIGASTSSPSSKTIDRTTWRLVKRSPF